VNDKSKFPNGGYLGFGLAHEYVHTSRKLIDPLLGQLKGSDRTLANVCDALGLRYSLRLLYGGGVDPIGTSWKFDPERFNTDYQMDLCGQPLWRNPKTVKNIWTLRRR
jgi:hypothetical protein